MYTNNNETIQALVTYFKGVRTEWGKIDWPEKQQVIAETIFVVGIIASLTIAVYVMDIVFKAILGLIPNS